jgi:hypothetical protein
LTSSLGLGNPPKGSEARSGFDPSAGDIPSAPGLFVTFAHPAADVAAFLERRPAEWRAAGGDRRAGTGWIGPAVLLLGFAAPIADLWVGFGMWVFAPLAFLGLFCTILVAVARGGGVPAFQGDERVQEVRGLLLALEGDLAPGKPVSGWVDLTGPDQSAKVVRSGRSRSGAPVRLCRDEWCRLKLTLRDGSGLRVSAVERRKTKDPVQKRRRTKPGSSVSVHSVDVRLVPNPALYRIRAADTPPGTPFGSLSLARIQAADGAVSAVATSPSGGLPAKDVLHLVDHVHRHLERASGAATPPPLPTGSA